MGLSFILHLVGVLCASAGAVLVGHPGMDTVAQVLVAVGTALAGGTGVMAHRALNAEGDK